MIPLPPVKPRFQFSLRTLPVAVSLFAVVIGWTGNQLLVARNRRSAMDSLRRRGAQFYDWDAKNRPIGFILWFRTIFMHDVRIGSVVMVNTSFSEKDASETQQTFPEAFIVFGPPNRPRPRFLVLALSA